MLEQRLKSRRNSLLENAMQYYEFISHTVDISGTDEEELFEIREQDNNGVISVYRVTGNRKDDRKIYERIFNSDDTRFINLHGLAGNDRFFTEKNLSSEIKIKIDGGEGKNVYNLNGNLKTVGFDASLKNAEIIN